MNSVVWNPTYSKDINEIEKVQRRFTKRAQRKCGIPPESYDKRITRWKIDTLEIRRVKIDLFWVYKIIYGHVDIDRDLFFRLNQSESEIKIYPLPLNSSCRNNTQCNTIADRTYQIWNGLPIAIRNSATISTFKRNLNKCDLNKLYVGKIIM
jgi:hypothetical protein